LEDGGAVVIAAITGHRPEKIHNWQFVEHQLYLAYKDQGVTTVIQGMAAGVDLTAAKIAYRNNIPFWCARPWAGHKPRNADVISYEKALKFAEKVIDVNDSETYPGAWVYDVRNKWMVAHGEMLIAVWDGTSGGTANCVKDGVKKGMPIWRIDPATHDVGWYEPKT
jgi:uncharacterized phage-like protein YoqJ